MADWKWDISPTHSALVRTIEELVCGLILEDEKGKIRYVNQRVLEWSGYQVSELEGQPVGILVPAELHSALKAEREIALKGDQRTRLSVFQRRDKRTFPIAVVPQAVDTVDGERVLLVLLIDLGELHTARPMGADDGSLSAELAGVATKLQSMAFAASLVDPWTAPLDHRVLAELSEREREVLLHLMGGTRVATIADKLFISPHTVRNHLKAIYRKLGVKSQIELIEMVRGIEKQPEVDEG